MRKTQKRKQFWSFNSPDESADACSCCGAVASAEGTNAVDKLAFANQLAIQPS
jgi:hypothetical protein